MNNLFIIVIRFDANSNGLWVVELIDTELDKVTELLQTPFEWEANRVAEETAKKLGATVDRR